MGDLEIGAKYRFLPAAEKDWWPHVAFYPFLDFPTGNAACGLGTGAAHALFPIWPHAGTELQSADKTQSRSRRRRSDQPASERRVGPLKTAAYVNSRAALAAIRKKRSAAP